MAVSPLRFSRALSTSRSFSSSRLVVSSDSRGRSWHRITEGWLLESRNFWASSASWAALRMFRGFLWHRLMPMVSRKSVLPSTASTAAVQSARGSASSGSGRTA